MAFIKWNKVGEHGPYPLLVESYRIKGSPHPKHRVLEYYGTSGQVTKSKSNYYEHMRPETMKEIPKGKQWVFEPKFDGSRHFAYIKRGKGIAFVNRREVNATEKFPEFWGLPNQLKGYKSTLVVDGEVVAFDKKHKYGSFKKLAQREHLKFKEDIRERRETIPLTYLAFDIIEKDEQPLINLSLLERKKILKKIIPKGLPQIKEITYTYNIGPLKKDIELHGGEGFVAKDLTSPYEEGKVRRSWLKAKTKLENDIVTLGYYKGTGKRKNTFGAILAGVWDKKANTYKLVGKIGSGFSDQQLKEYRKRFNKLKTKRDYVRGDIPRGDITYLKPSIVMRVRFTHLTPDGRYREPRHIGERKDIKSTDTHPFVMTKKALKGKIK